MMKRIQAITGYLAKIEIWPVAFLIAASVASERALPLALGGAGLFWGVRWLAYRRLSVRTLADWAIVLLLLMVPVTLWASPLPDTTRIQVYRLLTGAALYYAIVNWAISPARLRSLAAGTVLAGLLLALYATVSVVWGGVAKLPFVPRSVYDYFSLLASDTVNANVMGGNLVILLPCSLAVLLFGWRHDRWFGRALAGLAALVITAILILTQSRGALTALGATVIAMTLLRWRRGWLLLLASAATGAIVVRSLGVAPVLDALTTSRTLGGIQVRLEVWSRALYMIQDFPFTGVGMGSFGPVADLLYPFFLASPGQIPHAHNLFLQVAVDLGIPGLIAWLAILMLVITTAWQVYRHGRTMGDGWVAGLGAGLLCSQVALAVHGLTDAVTWGMVRPAPIVWGLWGLAVAGWNVHLGRGGGELVNND